MAWNEDKPADTEKVRLLGQVIRSNWKALEEGSDGDADAEKLKQWAINLVDRSTIGGANTPSVISDAGQVYARTIGSNVELCYEDADSHEVQLTRASEMVIASDGSTSLPGGLLLQWGKTTVSGVSPTVTYPTPFSTATYSLSITMIGSSFIGVSSSSPATATDFTVALSAGTRDIYWMAIGK